MANPSELAQELAQIAPALKAGVLAEAFPAMQRYHGKIVVIKYGGHAMTEACLQQSFARDVALLQLMGIHLVIVHGGGPQIEAALQKIGKSGQFIQGMRVTDAQTMEIVEWVLAGAVQQQIVSLINHHGNRAVGLTGKDGGLLTARRLLLANEASPGEWLDIGQVGEVAAVQSALIKILHDRAFIPVITPIALDEMGVSYNINADLVAGKLAAALNAEKLILMTNIAGVMDHFGQIIPTLHASEIDKLIRMGTIADGMRPKIAAALEAVESGVDAVHIIDGRIQHALLSQMFNDQGLGTVICGD